MNNEAVLNVSKQEAENNSTNILLVAFSILCIGFAIAHFIYAQKFNLEKPELIAIGVFNVWLLIISLIDIKYKEIPLWLTAPVIIGAIVYRFFPVDLVQASNAVLGLNLYPFDAALGVCFGFITVDMITHFGNWLAKFPSSSQGLLPVWIAIIPLVLTMFVPIYPLWVIPLVIIGLRVLSEIGYSKNDSIKKVINWMCTNAAVTYVVLFTILFAIGYAFLYNRGISEPTIRIHLVVFILCFSFVLEEIFIPMFSWIKCRLKISKTSEESDTLKKQSDERSVLGGGDATLTAAIGGLWGAVVVNNCLLMAFVIALLVFGSIKLIAFIFKNNFFNSENPPEVPFAPFIVISAQIILIAEIMIRSPQTLGSCSI